MVIRAFAHWLLWLCAGGLLLGGLFAGAAFGFFGTEVHDALSTLFEPLVDAALTNSEKLVVGAKVAGALITVVTGLFGLHKAWHYAERNLPRRLEDYIKQSRNVEVIGERNAFLQNVATQGLAFDTQKIVTLRENVGTKLDVLDSARDSWRKQQATIDYVEARLMIANADDKAAHGHVRDAHNLREQAVRRYFAAAQSDRDDLRAWRLAAEQAELIQHYDDAIAAWDALATAHKEREDFAELAGALYCKGKCLLHKSEDPTILLTPRQQAREACRDCLDNAVDELTKCGDLEGEKTRLLARTCELLGRVRIDLAKYPSAATRLNQAYDAYKTLRDDAGIERIVELSEKLREAYPQANVNAMRSPLRAIAASYERLADALLNDRDPSTLKAMRALQSAMTYLERIEPKPTDDIARVRQKLAALNAGAH